MTSFLNLALTITPEYGARKWRLGAPPARSARSAWVRFPSSTTSWPRLDLGPILARHVPTNDRRVTIPYADGLGILLRSIVVEREPIYRQGETLRTFAAGLYGLPADAHVRVGDDQLGRALPGCSTPTARPS